MNNSIEIVFVEEKYDTRFPPYKSRQVFISILFQRIKNE